MENDLYIHKEKKVAELEKDIKALRELIKRDLGVTDEDIEEYLIEDAKRPKIKTKKR